VLADLSELDAATNERKIAEGGGNRAIGRANYCTAFRGADRQRGLFHPGPHGAGLMVLSAALVRRCRAGNLSCGVAFHRDDFSKMRA